MINSPHNAKVKLARALAGKPKERRENGAFLAEGARLLEDALAAGWKFRFALLAEDASPRAGQAAHRLSQAGVTVELVGGEVFASLAETASSQGILAALELPQPLFPSAPNFLILLDQIRDPGNLGTLLRAAAAVGTQAVILPPETSDPFAPKVVRAAMGAHFRLPIFTLTWEEIRARLRGLKVFLAETENASPCWQADLRAPLALVIGGEAEGASPQARALADENLIIPMPGGMESLNAAMAGTVLMFEVLRQRQEKSR
ncbi:MAG: RNA methyltransferase [Anaerolineales bacterium]